MGYRRKGRDCKMNEVLSKLGENRPTRDGCTFVKTKTGRRVIVCPDRRSGNKLIKSDEFKKAQGAVLVVMMEEAAILAELPGPVLDETVGTLLLLQAEMGPFATSIQAARFLP